MLSITTFCFHGGNCTIRELKVINVLLKELTSLITLDISDTSLGPQKVKALTSGIHLTNLKKLELSNFENLNCIQELLGAFPFSVFLPRFLNVTIASDEIEVLSDALNIILVYASPVLHFGTDGTKALAEGLKHCTNLHTLDLSHNSICADGAKALADCLQHVKNLYYYR